MKRMRIISKVVVLTLLVSLSPIRLLDINLSGGIASAESVTSVTYSTYVNFADPDLEDAIKLQFNIINPHLTTDDMQEIVELNIYNKDISSFDGLQHAPNLRGITIVGGSVSGLNTLKPMNKLQDLILENTVFSEFDNLSNLTQLRTLRLTGFSNLDLPSVTQSVYLEQLQINHTNLSDVSSIENMSNLKYLYFEYTQIDNVTPICQLINLKDLVVSRSSVSDISCMSNLVNLEGVNISHNNISDISSLTSLPNLKSIIANNNNISSIPNQNTLASNLLIASTSNTILSSLPESNLEVIDLSSNKISDIRPLNTMPNLVNISLDANNIQDISSFETKSNMSSLSLNSNQISDISYLKAEQNDDMIYLGLKKNRIDIPKYKTVIDAFIANGTNVEYSDQVTNDNSDDNSSNSGINNPIQVSDSVVIDNDTAIINPIIQKKTIRNQLVNYTSIDVSTLKEKAEGDLLSNLNISIEKDNEQVVINIPKEVQELFEEKSGNINIALNGVSYSLPISILRDDIDVQIKKLSQSEIDKYSKDLKTKLESLYEFDIYHSDGSKYHSDNNLLTRKIKLNGNRDDFHVVSVSDYGNLIYIPFKIEETDESRYVVFKRNSNSIYGIEYSDLKTINTDHWVEPYLNNLQSKLELFDKNIDLNKKITREEFVHYLITALGLTSNNTESINYSDTTNSPYYNDVVIGSKLDIVSGYSNNIFGPDLPIKREEMASIAARVLKLFNKPNVISSPKLYSDNSSISKWAKDSVYLIRSNNIMIGDTNNDFRPRDEISVAESVVVIHSILKFFEMI